MGGGGKGAFIGPLHRMAACVGEEVKLAWTKRNS
jgi:hypothetical protein